MEHFLQLDERLEFFLNTELFPAIYRGEVTLFLGAGSSVTEKKFLGQDIIDFYQDKLGIDVGTTDLIEFMDVIKSRHDFVRDDFDNYITAMLSKLRPNDTHKTIVSLNWNEIITTNVDLIIEQAFDAISDTSMQNKSPKYVRNMAEASGLIGNGYLRYVKLNGCISDKRKYPLVFSSQDFNDSKSYHKHILKSLSDLSFDAKFLSIGYSFSDGLSRYLIKYFDSFNYRHKKPMYCVDPFIQEGRLEYLKQQGIFIIKLTTYELFNLYKSWENTYADTIIKRKGLSYETINHKAIVLPSKLRLSLGTNIIQLTKDSKLSSIKAESYYQGEKPTYEVIRRDYDVVKMEKLIEIQREVESIIANNNNKLIPVIFLTGLFGTGKSTFSYRLIDSLIHIESLNCVAFEIYDLTLLRTHDLEDLFSLTEAENIIITCEEIELDSAFKEMMDLRNKLSVELFTKFNIYIVVSIRENILEKYLRRFKYSNIYEINCDSKFNRTEAQDFIDKLAANQIVSYRDISEKNELIDKVLTDYDGDSFISLISIVSKNNFEEILFDAYTQLSKVAREAFVYTSLLYQYKILMPSSLLMRLVSKDWASFEEDVLKYDSKNILIQEVRDNDLFFRTKHSIISEKLVNKILHIDDEKFDKIRKIVLQLIDNDANSKLFVNLLKSLRHNSNFDEEKLNRLFDIADPIFPSNPHFALHYSINLQVRKDEYSLKKAIERVTYAQSFLEYRSHRLIHRRASLNYELARLYYKKEKVLNRTIFYIEEARELFEVKRIEDPFSSYSYLDYINLELWVLNKINLTDKEILILHIKIQELFDLAFKTVFENTERLYRLKSTYLKHLENNSNNRNQSLLEYLDELYKDDETRPYSLVLKYNYFIEKEIYISAYNLIDELEYFSFNNEVAKLLFTYYGRNLHLPELRAKYFKLVRKGYDFKNRDKLRYNFFSYIAESYNANFNYSFEHLSEIQEIDVHLNPNLQEVWLNENAEFVIFNGIISYNKKGFTIIKISELQQKFAILKESIKQFNPKPGDKFKVYLHFFIKGIRAELLNKEEETAGA